MIFVFSLQTHHCTVKSYAGLLGVHAQDYGDIKLKKKKKFLNLHRLILPLGFKPTGFIFRWTKKVFHTDGKHDQTCVSLQHSDEVTLSLSNWHNWFIFTANLLTCFFLSSLHPYRNEYWKCQRPFKHLRLRMENSSQSNYEKTPTVKTGSVNLGSANR